MTTILKRKALKDVFKQFQRLPEWPMAKTANQLKLSRKKATIQGAGPPSEEVDDEARFSKPQVFNERARQISDPLTRL